MAYKKKTTYRKRSTRRNFKRKYGRKRVRKPNQYYFTRYLSQNQYGYLTANSLTDTGYGLRFTLSDVVNYTEFTALYDMYKINAIKLSFLPQVTQNISLTGVQNPAGYARLYSAIDRTDSSAPTTTNQIKEYASCKWTPLLKPHTRYIPKPAILDASGFSINTWVSCASPLTVFYGLKVAIEAMGSSVITTMSYSIDAKFYLSFKNVK